MSSMARYFVTQLIAVIISLWLFPIKIFLDTTFGILGAFGSIVIEIISILTGETNERIIDQSLGHNNNFNTIIGRRRKHYSAGDVQSSYGENTRSLVFENMSNATPISPRARSNPVFGIYQHASDPSIKSSPPPLTRSDSLRAMSHRNSFNLQKKRTCPVHGNNPMQKAKSVPLTTPNSLAANTFSLSNVFKSCANAFDVFENYNGSEFAFKDSIAAINDIRNTCTCSLSTSGASSPVLNSSCDYGSGRSIRVKINKSLKNKREMQELERQMAKLERRRHKSGELREMRRKQQEQEQQTSLDSSAQEIYVNATLVNGKKEKDTSQVIDMVEDERISICTKESDER